MATQVQFRRGTTGQHSAFTGAVGDLVKCHDQVGLLVKQLPGTPAYWIVQWSNGVLDTVNPYLLEVINESR